MSEPLKDEPMRESHPSSTEDGKVRWFLVIVAAAAIVLVFTAYMYTKDIRVLYTSTGAALIAAPVYAYYFPKRK